jgi:hypothetical protein
MVLPSPENVCSIPGQTHELLTDRRDFISVPVPIFEMAHLRTYQREFVSRYCRLFSILELDQFAAQQANREVSISILIQKSRSQKWGLCDFRSWTMNAKRVVFLLFEKGDFN